MAGRKRGQVPPDGTPAAMVRVLVRLGKALLTHPSNERLRRRLAADPDPADRFQTQLLRLVFRLLLLDLAGAVRGQPHPTERGRCRESFRQSFSDVFPLLDQPPGCLPDLEDTRLDDAAFLATLGSLPAPRGGRAAGVPGLGLLYQQLLEFRPVLDPAQGTFDLIRAEGHRRKTTGSYYTPAALVDSLLDSTLEPILDEASAAPDPEVALLSLKICDPACGSGHFLVAAGRRIAARLHRVRTPNGSVSTDRAQSTFAESVRCLYGVDRDPLAVELCRAALSMECGTEKSSPTFLDAQIRCGNSLIGALPALAGGHPDLWTAGQLTGKEAGLAPEAVVRLCDQHGVFHWHRAFPQVFRLPRPGEQPDNPTAGWCGGFDVVLGNPPWERIKVQEREWFAVHCPAVANAPDAAARRRLVARLREEQPALHIAYDRDCRRAEAETRFLLRSGRYPLSGRGDINAYGPFVETSRLLLRPGGRAGLVVPSGLATDDTLKDLFRDLLETGSLVCLLDFHNRRGLFPGVQGNVKFCLVTLCNGGQPFFTAAAQMEHPAQVSEPGRTWTLSAATVARVNPNTLHCPTFATARDADLVTRIHERFPVLVRDGSPAQNPWQVCFWTMFHMTRDAGHFRTEETLQEAGWRLEGNVFLHGNDYYLPLYEAKLIRQFNHRGSTFAGIPVEVRFRTHARTGSPLPAQVIDSSFRVRPRFWVSEGVVRDRAGNAGWFLGFRNAISAVADARSLVAAIVPRAGVGNSLPLIAGLAAPRACLLLALLNSFVLDYVLRQKASGGNLNFHVLKQLPVPGPEQFQVPCPWSPAATLADWFVSRVLELTYTSTDLDEFARGCGHQGPPFPWNEDRRHRLRCELDAACFLLYGLNREETEYILGTFTIAERREVKEQGRPASREDILRCYDRLQQPG
jgi:Eco57I restriction-modification methylase